MILATVLVSTAVAFAGPAPATLQGDLDAAAAYWQAAPVHCSSESISSPRMSHRTAGEATIPDPAEGSPCIMKISRGMSRRVRCLVVVHEYGHWLGLEHSSDRSNPMFPVTDPKMVIPECEHA